VLGDSITRRIPRGYANLADQLRRALLSTFLGIAEASSRSGSDRLAQVRCARREASAALEAIQLLRLAPQSDVEHVLLSLDRLCAMLTRLAGLGHRTRDRYPVPDRHAPPEPPSNTNSNTDTPSNSPSPELTTNHERLLERAGLARADARVSRGAAVRAATSPARPGVPRARPARARIRRGEARRWPRPCKGRATARSGSRGFRSPAGRDAW